ncbi:hypothetical protein K2O51_22865 [Cupriavidus pinatubonensis]|uniref:hypothetical protein n=1 Tax=Cupriavidus pinatubonensis TaxID=248026 RepID=UPI001C7365E4|nr:hypothetical protein [Cupriavidus pinatubonensis]QYY30217.1 hypothetical protein K2O51_22865 [Cupriavidus pinatubonensis]
MTIQIQRPPQPTYEISDEFVCLKCSKPRIYVEQGYGWDYQIFDCPHNRYAPFVHACAHFTREPGVD